MGRKREMGRRVGREITSQLKNGCALWPGNNPASADLHRPFRGRRRMRKMDWRAVDLSRGRACEAPPGIRSHYRVREDPAWLYLSFRPQVRRPTEFKVDEGEVSVTAGSMLLVPPPFLSLLPPRVELPRSTLSSTSKLEARLGW